MENPKTKSKKKWLYIAVGAVLICGGLLAIIFVFLKDEAPVYFDYVNDEYGVSIQYPDYYVLSSLTEDQIAGGIFFRIERQEPAGLFSLRKEEGVGKLRVLGGSVMDQLIESVNKKYPARFPDYQKELFEETVIGNEQAALFEFTYTGTDQETRMKQRFIIIVKESSANYLSVQTQEDSFDELDAEFTQMIDSFRFIN
ncbi:MAG: hypothetical protein ABIG66_03420 [Candidatus Kerfeldbacteria bacterium]